MMPLSERNGLIMDVKQLRSFIAVARSRSFLKAADELFVSRQALSKTISQLETELNLSLFTRTSKGVLLTAAGEFLYPRARALVNEMDKLKAETIDAARQALPTVRFVMVQGVFGVFAEKLGMFAYRHRDDMDLKMRSCLDADCDSVLSGGKADALISFTPPNNRLASTEVLTISPLAFLINKNNPAISQVHGNPEALTALPKLLYTGGREKSLWWKDFPGRNDLVCSDLDYTFQLLNEDRGILPIPQILIPKYIDYAEVYAPASMQEWIPLYYSTLNVENYNTRLYNIIEEIRTELREFTTEERNA